MMKRKQQRTNRTLYKTEILSPTYRHQAPKAFSKKSCLGERQTKQKSDFFSSFFLSARICFSHHTRWIRGLVVEIFTTSYSTIDRSGDNVVVATQVEASHSHSYTRHHGAAERAMPTRYNNDKNNNNSHNSTHSHLAMR